MAANCGMPFSVAICRAWVGALALLVPEGRRGDWKREWSAEIWHRWQFLFHSGEWNGREKLRLFVDCAGALPDAAWHFFSRETIRRCWREGARSPWSCLGALAGLLAILAIGTRGLPANRQLAGEILRTNSDRVVLLWAQSFGRKPHGVPADVFNGWRIYGHSLESSGRFNIAKSSVRIGKSAPQPRTVVTTDEGFFNVLGTHALKGALTAGGVAIGYDEWITGFHGDAGVLGSKVSIGKKDYGISAVLPRGFEFLSRQRCTYLVQRGMTAEQSMVIARVRPRSDSAALERELAKIAADSNYSFLLTPQLRITTVRQIVWAPVRVFALTVSISALLSFCAFRVRIRHARLSFVKANRRDSLRRIGFFAAKLCLCMAILFAAGLEWARPESSMLLSWTDGGSGPLIVWLFVFGTMAVSFWTIADQRGRCRVCLRLLGFPVRMGCPGCVLLDWAGTELLCPEGHGVLHVPHMATSWEEEADRWVSFDESWRELMAGQTNG